MNVKNKFISFILFFVIASTNLVFSQNTTYNNIGYDTLESKYTNPSDSLYNGNWENLYLKMRHANIFDKNDTVQIILCSKDSFASPLTSKVISKYGPRGRRFHTGTDVKCTLGQELYSAFDGKVRVARAFSSYGNIVVIRHFNGLETVYAHLSKIKVNVNDYVKAGDLIGLGGRTGRATTEHLHFEVRYLGEHFNSEKIIDFAQGKLISDTLFLVNSDFVGYKDIDTSNINNLVAHNKSTSKKANVKTNNSSDKKVHYIKKGDTLYSIALRFGTTVASICDINNISPERILDIGMKLIIE